VKSIDVNTDIILGGESSEHFITSESCQYIENVKESNTHLKQKEIFSQVSEASELR